MFRFLCFLFTTSMLARFTNGQSVNAPDDIEFTINQLEHYVCKCQVKSLLETKPCGVSGPGGETSAARRTWPVGYEHFPGVGYYKFYPHLSSFLEAISTCHKDGAYLAYPNSDKEMEVLQTLYARHPDLIRFVYLGFFKGKDGKFRTLKENVPLDKASYGKWNGGEPNNYKGNENCGSTYRSGFLNDISCGTDDNTRLPFICEL